VGEVEKIGTERRKRERVREEKKRAGGTKKEKRGN
jgi:hypothetical protein